MLHTVVSPASDQGCVFSGNTALHRVFHHIVDNIFLSQTFDVWFSLDNFKMTCCIYETMKQKTDNKMISATNQH